MPSPRDLKVELQITGGYFSYMQGDFGGHGRAASVFQVHRKSVDTLRLNEIVQRGRVIVATGTYECIRYGSIRPVLHIIGPEPRS